MPEETPVAPQTIVRSEIVLVKEDLTNAKFSEIEVALYEKDKDLRKQKEAARKERQKLEKILEKAMKVGTDVTPVALEGLEAELKKLGDETQGGCSRSLGRVAREEIVELDDGTKLEYDEDADEGPYYISERGVVAYRRPLTDKETQRVAWTESYAKLVRRTLTLEEQAALNNITECEKLLEELTEAITEVQQEKSELPMRKRQAEAAVARRVMEATPEGQFMADALGMEEDKPLLEAAKDAE